MFVHRTCRPDSSAWPKMPSDAAIAVEMERLGLGYMQALRRIQARQIIRGRR